MSWGSECFHEIVIQVLLQPEVLNAVLSSRMGGSNLWVGMHGPFDPPFIEAAVFWGPCSVLLLSEDRYKIEGDCPNFMVRTLKPSSTRWAQDLNTGCLLRDLYSLYSV